jgi:hypothetical protein
VSLTEIQEARARVEAQEAGDGHSRAVGVCKVVTPMRWHHDADSGAAYNTLPGPACPRVRSARAYSCGRT